MRSRPKVSRAHATPQRVAALNIVVVDGSMPLGDMDRQLVQSGGPLVVLINKGDLPRAWATESLAVPAGVACHVVAAIDGRGFDTCA